MKSIIQKILSLIFVVLISNSLFAQDQVLSFALVEAGDTIQLGEQTIIPESIKFTSKGISISPKYLLLNDIKSIIFSDKQSSLEIYFRTLPKEIETDIYHKDTSLIFKKEILTKDDLYSLKSSQKKEAVFFEGLNKSGSLSRGITVGNTQDAVLRSNLNLQLSGKINPNTTIKASITDNQVPVYAEGISQTLREFDRVFIEIENKEFGKVLAGDYNIGPSGNYFLKFDKRISGAGLITPLNVGNGTLTIHANGALARGEFHRNTFRGEEGNQGPYKLIGKNNELTIIVVSGSERIYIDGRLLVRGLENDYVIDYTTGEVTFTSLRPITKDSRIVVEFQYTVQNYIRSIIYGGADWKSKKWEHAMYLYSEQDSKNQPLRSLSDDEKSILYDAGNDPTKAVTPTWSETNYDANRILYSLKDTLGNDSVFVYSTNPSDTLYEVFFSFIGNNQGDYLPTESSVNGRVYVYIPPIGGVPQGTHIPYSIIPRPQKIQVLSYRGKYNVDENNNFLWEIAYSNNDVNTFSDLDSEEQKGYAGRLGYNKSWKSNNWNYNADVKAEFTDQNFKTVERIRNVEFTRDWNIQQTTSNDLILGSALFSAGKSDKFIFNYKGEVLSLLDYYSGFRNSALVRVKSNGWFVLSNLSYLAASDTATSSQFFRQRSRVQKNFESNFYLGLKSESESNTSSPELINSNKSSYRFYDNRGFVGYGDTLKTFIEGGVFKRTDDTVRLDIWQRAADANGVFMKSRLSDRNLGSLLFSMQYRQLNTINDSLENLTNSITSRIQYNNRFFKNFVGWNTFYESSMGSEPRKDYKYLKVPLGTGTHVWVDYNDNGIEEIDEFEQAPFADQGEYIKIFVITRARVPVSNIKFTQQLDFNFDRLRVKSKSFIRKFNWQTYLLLESKELLTESTNSLNPFNRDIADSLLIQSIQNFRTTLFFNRSSPVYGADYTYLQNTAKNLLSYGIENVRVKEHTFNLRYLLRKKTDFRITYKNIEKTNVVPNFSTRNYTIQGNSIKPILAYQGSPYFRASTDLTLENSVNINEGGETLIAQKIGGELEFKHPKKLTMLLRAEYVNNDFTGNEFSPIGYEMLKGLKNGDNVLWQLSLQKNLTTFLQIVLNYNGRTSENSPIIHTGTMQVKAFF